jgi:hypothetical protein
LLLLTPCAQKQSVYNQSETHIENYTLEIITANNNPN